MRNFNLVSKIRIYLFLTFSLIIILLFATNCTKSQDIKVDLKLIRQFGQPDDSEEEMFGLITSFTTDQYQNLYVSDDAFKVIRKFSKEGNLIQNFGFGAGRGPGEFSAIHEICVDNKSNLYVLDKINLNLTVFDSLNNLISIVKLPFLPAQIISPDPLVCDVLGFPFTYRGNLVHRYNINDENPDKPILTYAERLTGEVAELSMRSGNSGRLVKAPSGNIYYSFFFPYLIYKFSPDGKLLMTFKGERTLTAPFISSGTGTVESPSGIKEFVILPDDILLVLVYDGSANTLKQYMDFIDGKDGTYLGSISVEELGIQNIRFIRADLYSNIYIDIIDPYPHILKYKLSLTVNE